MWGSARRARRSSSATSVRSSQNVSPRFSAPIPSRVRATSTVRSVRRWWGCGRRRKASSFALDHAGIAMRRRSSGSPNGRCRQRFDFGRVPSRLWTQCGLAGGCIGSKYWRPRPELNWSTRSCEPHLKAEHMAAPTNAANVKKVLVNSEPSTHGTQLPIQNVRSPVANGGKADNICSF